MRKIIFVLFLFCPYAMSYDFNWRGLQYGKATFQDVFFTLTAEERAKMKPTETGGVFSIDDSDESCTLFRFEQGVLITSGHIYLTDTVSIPMVLTGMIKMAYDLYGEPTNITKAQAYRLLDEPQSGNVYWQADKLIPGWIYWQDRVTKVVHKMWVITQNDCGKSGIATSTGLTK